MKEKQVKGYSISFTRSLILFDPVDNTQFVSTVFTINKGIVNHKRYFKTYLS